MAEEIVKCVMSNNTVFLKEEYEDNDYAEGKTQNTIDGNNINDPFDLGDNVNDNAIKKSKSSLVNIERELELSDIKDEITVTDVKIEKDNKYLFCSNCQEDYQDYCIRCQMLVNILDGNSFSTTDMVIQGIPRGILEMRELFGYVGIFALKVIPEGVQFGPITGLDCSWRIRAGKLMIKSEESKSLHWMWYINSARNISEQNLLAFQYDGNLYYRCVHEIQADEELLVHFGDECDSLDENVEINFIPVKEESFKDVFACTFCCLGFSSRIHLNKHKTICPNNDIGGPAINDITQCYLCKIYLERKEYSDYHEKYCHEKYTRLHMLPPLKNQMIEVKRHSFVRNKGKKQKRETYNCLQCKYQTTYKSDLINHANEHYPVKVCSCKLCHRRFKRQDTLKAHLINVHNYIEENGVQSQLKSQYKCTKCDYKSHIRSRLKTHLYTHDEVKRFKCSDCDYGTNYKCHLKKHVNAIHCRAKKYKCAKCDFETFYQSNLSQHLYTHEEGKQFKCAECGFETNYKAHLERHIIAIHRELKKYKCSKCDFETSYDSNLRSHLYNHEEVKRLKCPECNYETNRKRNLKAHVNSRHSEVKAYKCTKCEFETSHDSSFKKHMYTHEEKKGLKCSVCDYETNNKRNLKLHMDTKHCKVKKYKCSKCDYESAYDASFRKHLYTHENEKRLTCSACEFKTNYKWHLKKHVNAKHYALDI